MKRLLIGLICALALGCKGGLGGPVKKAPTFPEPQTLTVKGPGKHSERTALPGQGNINYTLEIPASYTGKEAVPLLVLLHFGYDGPKPSDYYGGDMINAFRPGLAGFNGIVVAPDALGGDWTDDQNEVLAVWLTKSLMKTYKIDPKKVIIAGFSMGGQGTWYIGGRHQDLFTGAIAVAAPTAEGNATWTAPIYVIHSPKDEVVPISEARRQFDKFNGKKYKIQFHELDNVTHYAAAKYAQAFGTGLKWVQEKWGK